MPPIMKRRVNQSEPVLWKENNFGSPGGITNRLKSGVFLKLVEVSIQIAV